MRNFNSYMGKINAGQIQNLAVNLIATKSLEVHCTIISLEVLAYLVCHCDLSSAENLEQRRELDHR